jgi:branched-chain amino acid transport system substrate-binding protein
MDHTQKGFIMIRNIVPNVSPLRFCLLILWALFGVMGCSPTQLAGIQTTSTQHDAFLIAAMETLPGQNGLAGIYSFRGAQLAIDEVNKHGGILWDGKTYDLHLIHGQGSDTSSIVKSMIYKIPSPVAFLGPDESKPALEALPLIAGTHIPQLTIAPIDELTEPSLNHNISSIFRLSPSWTMYAQLLASIAIKQNSKSIAIVTIDNDYGHVGEKLLTKYLKNSGPHLTNISLQPGLLDTSTVTEMTLTANPGTIICWSTEAESALYLQKLRESEWKGQFLVGNINSTFAVLAGKAGIGVIGATSWLPSYTNPTEQSFITQYRQRYGEMPNEYAAASYDGINLIASALAKVGPKHEDLQSFFANLTGFEGIRGILDIDQVFKKYGIHNTLSGNLFLAKIEDDGTIVSIES